MLRINKIDVDSLENEKYLSVFFDIKCHLHIYLPVFSNISSGAV